MPNRPEFIYFDLGNVLLRFDHGRAARQMAEVAGVPVKRVLEVVFESDLEWRFEAGEIDARQFHAIFCEQTGSAPEMDQLHLAAADIFEPNSPVEPIVAGLRDAGHRLGILSNTNSVHWDFVSRGRYPFLSEHFCTQALSFELQAMKPQPAIYRSAADLVGLQPEEIFFVDDREENVEGARAAGFDAVPFTTAEALAADLADRGVTVG